MSCKLPIGTIHPGLLMKLKGVIWPRPPSGAGGRGVRGWRVAWPRSSPKAGWMADNARSRQEGSVGHAFWGIGSCICIHTCMFFNPGGNGFVKNQRRKYWKSQSMSLPKLRLLISLMTFYIMIKFVDILTLALMTFFVLNNQTLQHVHFYQWGWFSGMVWVPRVLNIKQLVWPWLCIFPCKLGELIIFLLAICSRPEKLNTGTCWAGGTFIPLVPKSKRYYM